MNIFKKKLAESDDESLPIDPIELYQTCNYREEFAYLRSIQDEVLKTWHSNRKQRDIICKMSTGSGKTLTGLLMLYSKLIELKEPALFVCPDKHLVEQTIQQANLYGIPVCQFEKPSEFPSDFLNSKKILICNFHKLFNGRSIFNRDKIKIGAIILDDAHKCVDIARENTTLKVPRSHIIAKRLFDLFAKSLEFQAPGAFHRLEGGDPFMDMRVPYWTWMDNNKSVIEVLNSYVSEVTADREKNPDVDGLYFKWNFMADNLLAYDCFISGNEVEITPIHVPYHEVSTFHEATHRYILSATFEDDYDLIRDLGIDHDSILKPIVPKDRKDVGKRLILAPTRFDSKLTENDLRKHISEFSGKGYNTVVLVPSEYKSRKWVEQGAVYVNKDNIEEALKTLKASKNNFMVFDNRYDGIDLNGDLCRILVLDGLPLYSSLLEQYIEVRMETLRAGKKAQIIEQGLGRGVRSGADHCVVYLMGNDLMSFLGYERNMQYFTPVTRAQLSLGLKLLDGEATTNSLKTLKDTAELCLTKNEDWIKFHNGALSKVLSDELDERKKLRLKLAEHERCALVQFKLRKYEAACDLITKHIANNEDYSPKERAWYYQFAAQMMYLGNKVTSNDLQGKACTLTTQMFHPAQGHVYKKILKKGVQASIVKNRLSAFDRPQDVTLYINDIIGELRYTPEIKSKNFEKKLDELGKFLGFKVQMPDTESGNGPDNLWCLTDGYYLILEAKSRAVHSEITRDNIEQLLHSEIWFNNLYGADAEYTLVTLQSPSKKGKNVNVHNKMKVLDGEKLQLLTTNLAQFGEAIKTTHPKSHSEEELMRLLEAYKLTPALFRQTYLININ
jgi:Type III restriction enzyme, res subunit